LRGTQKSPLHLELKSKWSLLLFLERLYTWLLSQSRTNRTDTSPVLQHLPILLITAEEDNKRSRL
jgi:hypothetical protein